MGDGSKRCRSFRMCLSLNDYHFKTNRYRSIYMNPKVTTNQNSTTDTQKLERKEHKNTHTKKRNESKYNTK